MEKTLVFLILIFLGWCMRGKLSGAAEKNGIKAIILNLALPATIFIALLKIDLESNLLWLPVSALLMNVLMIFGAFVAIRLLHIEKNTAQSRSIFLLFPSFAPGLSCFPFLIEYFGDEMLANAAFADVGNKIFVLFILYIWALRMYFNKSSDVQGEPQKMRSKLRDIFSAMMTQPINLVMVVAIGLLCFGVDLDALPLFIRDTIGRIGLMMTPLILLFIGFSLKVSFKEAGRILQVLLLRSGMAFFFSAILLFVLPAGIGVGLMTLIVLFPQSSCSFWPFAHMCAIHKMEERESGQKTFDLNYSVNILAFSLPLSTAIIVGICTYPDLFVQPITSIYMAVLMTIGSLVLFLFSRMNGLSFGTHRLLKRKTS